MKCLHCKNRVEVCGNVGKVEIGVLGMRVKVKICGDCKKAVLAAQGISHSSESSKKKPKTVKESVFVRRNSDSRLDKTALSKDEIKRTQALRPTVRYQGLSRELSSVDGDVQRVFVISDGPNTNETRYALIDKKLRPKFRGRPYEIIHENQNTGEVIARRI